MYSEDGKILVEIPEKNTTIYLPSQVEEIKEEALEGVEHLMMYVPISTKCKDFSVLCKAYRATLFYMEETRILSRFPLSGVCGFEPYLKGKFPDCKGYDSCFSSVKEEHQKIDTAISRLYYPYQLTNDAKEKYEKYLKQKYRVAIKQVIATGEVAVFHWLFNFRIPDIYMIREFKEEAIKAQRTEIILFLLTYEKEHFVKQEENFEL
jgi:hypothetical protein